MERARVVILGAGVAGAATAYGLARRGVSDVLVLERAAFPGAHASGRNAGLIRRNLRTETDCVLADRAARWMQRPPDDFARDLAWRETGSLLLFRDADRPRVERDFALQRAAGLVFERISAKEACRRQPLLDEHAFAEAQWTPGDARIDVVALLHGFLESAARRGVRIRCGVAAEGLLVESGRCAGVRTSGGDVRAEWVVNAAGGWANGLAAGSADPLAMTPCRRTMLVTEALGADAARPFTWDDGRGFYFREDHGGLLWSPCDEVPTESCEQRIDPAWVDRARAAARALTPSVAEARIAFQWACLRTLTPDREVHVGPDPALPGLFWVAGLGGHGVTLSPLLAELAADLLLDGRSDVVDPARVAPRRAIRPRSAP